MRGRAVVVIAAAASIALGAELLTRAFADRLPEPARWSTPELNYKQRQIDDLADEGGIDVMITGTSLTDAGIAPELLEEQLGGGVLAYNASVGAASIRMVEVWTRAVVDDLDPSVAVIGLSTRELNPNDPRQGDLEEEFFAAPAVEELLDTGGPLDAVDRELADWSYLVRYRRELRSPENLLGTAEPPWGPDDTSAGGQFLRFVDQRYQASARQRRFLQTGGLNDFTVGEAQLTTVRRLVRFLEGRGVETLVVAMPTTADWISYHPDGREQHDLALKAAEVTVTEAGGSYFRVGPWPDELFADALHLNRAGTLRLTNALTQMVVGVRTGSR